MNQAIQAMLSKYQIKNPIESENALKEIIQEIALLGLHRGNFFEKAAFYGGTALRILYGLPRYSEDLDFTLLKKDLNFNLQPYFSFIEKELESYGFDVHIERVDKKNESKIESAFIKTNTKIHFIKIKSMSDYHHQIQKNSKLQIKFEIDIDPVVNFEFEARYLLQPTSFPVISLKKPDLFAGKIHALLFRKWKNRIKGRDFYDYVWYLKNKTPVNISYLREKSIQSKSCTQQQLQDLDQLKKLLNARFKEIDFQKAKDDVRPFIKETKEIDLWCFDFFQQITEKLENT